MFTIQPPSASPADEVNDEGMSTIKALGNALASDLNQLSLYLLSRSIKDFSGTH